MRKNIPKYTIFIDKHDGYPEKNQVSIFSPPIWVLRDPRIKL